MTRPAPDPELAATTPEGVQPQQDDHLLCLECGHWYRGLYTHVRSHDGLTVAEYRERHGLAVRHPLAAPSVRDAHSTRMRQQIATDPTWHAQFRHPPEKLAEYAARGRAASAEAGSRPERRATTRATWDRAGRRRSVARRGVLDDRARALGWDDLGAYLAAHRESPSAALVADLGITAAAAQRWRRRLLHRPLSHAESTRLARQRGLDAKAATAGFDDFDTLITETIDRPIKPLARETGIAVNTIKKHRARSCELG